jgi:hypothetical protein
MVPLALRPLMPEDESAARALLMTTFAGTRYAARLAEQLDAAMRFEDPEYLAVLAEADGAMMALALFGTVAGARSCTKLHVLAGTALPALADLATGVVKVCADAAERLIVAEIPNDAPFRPMAQALGTADFAEEGRADDYVADGIALRLMVWRPRGT